MNRNRFHKLARELGGMSAVRSAGPAAIQAILSAQDAADCLAIYGGPTNAAVEAELTGLEALDGWILCPDDEGYPQALRDSQCFPPLIFGRGQLQQQDDASVAIIGARKATSYGLEVARSFGLGLAQSGVTVVSGMARGIDSSAHKAALEGSGRTLAVTGCGLDTVYPSENRGLAAQIIQRGAILSEYPLGTPPDAFNFPERNQVLAALTLGTVVVEAAERSGTMITCRFALEENRQLFAVPGDITRHNSRGTNRLIRDGAVLVQTPRDILLELAPRLRAFLKDWDLPGEEDEASESDNRAGQRALKSSRTKPPAKPRAQIESAPALQPEFPGLGPSEQDEEKKFSSEAGRGKVSLESSRPDPSVTAKSVASPTSLSPEASAILEVILHEPIQFDDLAAQLTPRGIPLSRLTSQLLMLELAGLIRQLPGRIYAGL